MKKFLKKSFLAVDETCKNLLLPMALVFAFVVCADAHMFNLSTGWTAYILSGVTMVAALYRWDRLTQIKVRAALTEKSALIEMRAEKLLKEGRKVISAEEGAFWWDDHFEDVMTWSSEITGCGKEAN